MNQARHTLNPDLFNKRTYGPIPTPLVRRRLHRKVYRRMVVPLFENLHVIVPMVLFILAMMP